MRLAPRLVLGDGPFAACGRPTGVYGHRAATRIAVASTFQPQWWHGRDLRQGCTLDFRVSVYDVPALRRVAVLDRARFPINEVAFHPAQPLIAIATGSYDGGYFYEGELLLWDLLTGAVVSLLDESREVCGCRFGATGQTLQIILRPRDDGGGADEGDPEITLHTTIESTVWERLGPGSVSAGHLTYTVMSTYDRPKPQGDQTVRETLHQLAEQAGLHYEARWHVWDVAHTATGEILAVRNNTALERWSASGERLQHVPDARDGVQLLPAPTGDVYVNLSGRISTDRWHVPSGVECLTPATGARHALAALDFPALLSMTETGAVLARDTDPSRHFERESGYTVRTEGVEGFSVTLQQRPPHHDRRGRDCVLLPENAAPTDSERWHRSGGRVVSSALDLGYYDHSNHYLRIDGEQHLYFLRWTPPWAREERWVCRLDPASLQVEDLFPVEWAPAPGIGLQVAEAVYLRGTGGDSLLLACHRTDGRGLRAGSSVLVRRALAGGTLLWSTALSAPVTALALLSERGLVAFALSDGHIGLLSSATGLVELLEPVTLDGVPCVVLSLAASGDQVVAGTMEGHIVVSELTI